MEKDLNNQLKDWEKCVIKLMDTTISQLLKKLCYADIW